MPHILAKPEAYANHAYKNTKGHTECVEFIRQTLHAPVTTQWTEGIKVIKGNVAIARGTAIATFVDKKYPQSGRRHAAIYLGQTSIGIQVLDQWDGQGEVRQRTIPFIPRSPGLSNDGNAFSTIEW